MVDTCFVITPIGVDNSPQRKRADRLCDDIVLPAIDGCTPELVVERSDRIQSSELITVRVVEEITTARLIIADLVDPNPNVYYELGIAESFRKPIIRFGGREAEALPFDVRDMRTIALPKYDDGRIDVADANRCIRAIREMLPEMLDSGYRPKSVVALAEKEARFDSLAEMLPADGDDRALLLHELALRVQDMTLELERLRSYVRTRSIVTTTTREQEDVRALIGTEKFVDIKDVLARSRGSLSLRNLRVGETEGFEHLVFDVSGVGLPRAEIMAVSAKIARIAEPVPVTTSWR